MGKWLYWQMGILFVGIAICINEIKTKMRVVNMACVGYNGDIFIGHVQK